MSRVIGALFALIAVIAAAGTPLAANLAVGPTTPAVKYPPVTEKTGLSVVITPQGGTPYELFADRGEELGDYHAPSGTFVERCIRVEHPDGPTVYFRPDRNSKRVEVVFENFTLKGPAHHLPPYSVDIRRNGKTIGKAAVTSEHWWGSRWRWQSSPRPIIHKVADLIRAHFILPYRKTSLPLFPNPITTAKAYAPMGFAGFMANMQGTGERDDIGPQTEAIAEFLILHSVAAEQTMFAQAEAAGTWPIHFRDEETGAPISKDRYPLINFYYNQQWSKPPIPLQYARAAGQFDEAHSPNESFVPFLLTEDPYDLEELEFTTNASLMANPGRKDGALIGLAQLRSWAWGLRDLFEAVRVVPDAPPRWLLPNAYFRKRLDLTREWMTAHWLHSTDPFTLFSHSPPSYDSVNTHLFGPWQDDFLTTMIGYGVYLGFDDWRPIFEWKLGNARGRLDGKSGYPRSRAIQYFLQTVKFGDPGQPPITSWGELAQYQYDKKKQAYQPIIPTPDGKFDSASGYYYSYLYGVLRMALLLGDDTVRPLYDWYAPQLTRLSYKWSYAASR